jgi:hypothetical protein
MKLLRLLFLILCLARWSAAAETNTNVDAERIRMECIEGRRHVCGRVLQVSAAGVVVDSGYTGLLQPPLNRNWVTRATVNPARPPAQVERAAPDSVAIGLVFLTDLPKRPMVHQYDYVSLVGYPSGQYNYVPAPGVSKTIRRFAAGLATAVRLTQEAKPQKAQTTP